MYVESGVSVVLFLPTQHEHGPGQPPRRGLHQRDEVCLGGDGPSARVEQHRLGHREHGARLRHEEEPGAVQQLRARGRALLLTLGGIVTRTNFVVLVLLYLLQPPLELLLAGGISPRQALLEVVPVPVQFEVLPLLRHGLEHGLAEGAGGGGGGSWLPSRHGRSGSSILRYFFRSFTVAVEPHIAQQTFHAVSVVQECELLRSVSRCHFVSVN